MSLPHSYLGQGWTPGGQATAVTMGSVLGKIAVETPQFELLKRTDSYEIRKYGPLVAAEVRASEVFAGQEHQGNKLDSTGFRLLASYIGAIGKPANVAVSGERAESIAMTSPVVNQPEKIAMTAPVVSRAEKVAMTTPVVTSDTTESGSRSSAGGLRGQSGAMKTEEGGVMAFYLPSKYSSVESAPKPLDERVHLVQIPPRKVAVAIFSGNTDMRRSRTQAEELFAALKVDQIRMKGDPASLDDAVWWLARYNPPWSLPWTKRNEVHIELES